MADVTPDVEGKGEVAQRMSPQEEARRRNQSERRMSRASELYDKDKKGYLTMEEKMMRELDVDGDGNLSRDELKRAASKIMETQKEASRWRNMGMVSMVAVLLLIAVMLGTTIIGNEISKESRVQGTMLTAKDGKTPVQTKSLETFAKLFDLPAFDINTLSQVKHLTLVFHGGMEGAFTITEAIKKKGSRAVTFKSANDVKITVDGESMMAMAEVEGKVYTVDPMGSQAVTSRGRRLKEDHEREPPRLYESHEFFTEANGFVGNSRKLSEDSDMGGFAAVALAAAESILDKYNTEFGTNHDSIGISGAFWTKPGDDGTSVKTFEVAVFLNVTSGLWAVSQTPTATGVTVILDTTTGDGLQYTYDAQSTLIKCDMKPFLKDDAFKQQAGIGEDFFSVDGTHITREGSFAIPLETYNFHGQAVFQQAAKAIINTPSDAQCLALQPNLQTFAKSTSSKAAVTVVNATGGFDRRLAEAVKPPTRHHLEGFRRELWEHGQSAASPEERQAEAGQMLRGLKTTGNTDDLRNKGSFPTGVPSDSHMGWWAASAAYDANKVNSEARWKHYGLQEWAVCDKAGDSGTSGHQLGGGSARAQFYYKCGRVGNWWRGYRNVCSMALAFAGSDDIGDWVQNAKAYQGGPGNKYHKGFWEYQNILAPCVNNHRKTLRKWGIELDYITGHSLGGAAATIYAQEHGAPKTGVATYGAPKTNYGVASVTGWRFMHADDPVTSSLCNIPKPWWSPCIMGPLYHVLTYAYEFYDKPTYKSERQVTSVRNCKGWRSWWCWFQDIVKIVQRLIDDRTQWDKCTTTALAASGSTGPAERIARTSANRFRYYEYKSLFLGLWGALRRHSAYDDYPVINKDNFLNAGGGGQAKCCKYNDNGCLGK